MTPFRIERNVSKQYYAVFHADNGEMVWETSEYYTRKEKAVKAIRVLIHKVYDSIPMPSFRSSYSCDVEVLDNTVKKPKTFKVRFDF